jgi:hypothetical protein
MGKGLETLAASSGFKGKAQRIDQRHKIKSSVLTVHVLYRVEPGNYLPLRDNIPKPLPNTAAIFGDIIHAKNTGKKGRVFSNSLFL